MCESGVDDAGGESSLWPLSVRVDALLQLCSVRLKWSVDGGKQCDLNNTNLYTPMELPVRNLIQQTNFFVSDNERAAKKFSFPPHKYIPVQKHRTRLATS